MWSYIRSDEGFDLDEFQQRAADGNFDGEVNLLDVYATRINIYAQG